MKLRFANGLKVVIGRIHSKSLRRSFLNGECGLMIDFVSFMQNMCCLYREYFIFLLTVI